MSTRNIFQQLSTYLCLKVARICKFRENNKFAFDEETLLRISNGLPNIDTLVNLGLKLSIESISIKFPPNSSIPVAAICLSDAISTLEEVKYALRESLSNVILYREKLAAPNEFAAVFLGRFYVDDAALRLYSAGEHLANAIVAMLEITEGQLDRYKQGRTSRQAIVGHYLAKEKPEINITKSILKLAKSKNWKKCRNYRDIWVHEQPPLIEGLGLVYKRRKRWQWSEEDKIHKLSFGNGDNPEYTLDDLLEIIQPAFFQLVEACIDVVGFYVEILESKGIVVTDDGISVKVF